MNARPSTLAEVAEHSASLEEFGRHLRDWLHALRGFSSRPEVAASVAEEPHALQKRFKDGAVADAWLAAYAEHLANQVGIEPPAWAFKRARFLDEPAFDEGSESATLRALALAGSPLPFKRRNIFTPSVDLPLGLRRGRPTKTADEKRRTNAERQRRFRQSQKKSLRQLKKQMAKLV